MDPLRLVARVVFAYVFALALFRVSGKRSVLHGDTTGFVLAIVVGDLFDDIFWAEVPAAQFIVATGTLMLSHVIVSLGVFHAGARTWQHALARGREE
jgi:uncharacterized membrane protein YcaP (DUF421 family)